MTDAISNFVERYAEYRASWGHGIGKADRKLIHDAIKTFLLDEAQQADDRASKRLQSLLSDLKHISQRDPASEHLISRMASECTALMDHNRRLQLANRICQEHAITNEDKCGSDS